MKFLLSLAVVLSFLAGPTSTRASSVTGQVIPYGSSGYWDIFVYFAPDGTYGYCGMSMGSKIGKEKLTLTIDPSGYYLFIDNDEWSLNDGDEYKSNSRIGDQTWGGNAVVYSPHGVTMRYSFDSAFGIAFAQGQAMDFQIGNFSRQLDLTGSTEAAKMLSACLTKYMPSSNPFGAANARPTSNLFK